MTSIVLGIPRDNPINITLDVLYVQTPEIIAGGITDSKNVLAVVRCVVENQQVKQIERNI